MILSVRVHADRARSLIRHPGERRIHWLLTQQARKPMGPGFRRDDREWHCEVVAYGNSFAEYGSIEYGYTSSRNPGCALTRAIHAPTFA